MGDLATATSTYVDAFGRLRSRLAGNAVPWIQQARETALSRFAEQGFPTTRDEEWKYTNVTPIQRRVFTPAEHQPDTQVTAAQLEPFVLADQRCHRMVFIDGHFARDLSALSTLPAGLTVSSLAAVFNRDAAVLRPYLGRYALTDTHGFAALNTAFLVDGAYVRVAQDISVADPIHFLFVSTGKGDSVLTQPRNLIVTEPGSRVTVIESFVSLGQACYFTNAITEVAVADNATVEHYKLGLESPKAFHIGGLYVRQGANSLFTSHNITLGGVLVRNTIHSTFAAEGGTCILNGLYAVSGRQHVDNHTLLDHAQPRCTSRELYKGVLDGRARAVFSGRIVVRQDAQHTDAKQDNKNLLLSRDAEVDTKPQLEIYADDVKCAHGATVGQLDRDAIYYLRSRGVDEETARSVLTYAFANDILDRIEIPSARSYVASMLAERLLHGRRIEGLK